MQHFQVLRQGNSPISMPLIFCTQPRILAGIIRVQVHSVMLEFSQQLKRTHTMRQPNSNRRKPTPPNKHHEHFLKHLEGKRTRGHGRLTHLPRCGVCARRARKGTGTRRCVLSGSEAQTARRRRCAQPGPAGSSQRQHQPPRTERRGTSIPQNKIRTSIPSHLVLFISISLWSTNGDLRS